MSRRRIADLMIASTAVANRHPLYTTNAGDFTGLGDLMAVIAVPRP
jgi:predicted nucleic acid-binding protein